MKSEHCRRGGAWLARERAAIIDEPKPTSRPEQPTTAAPPATAPMWEHARVQSGAVLVMAKVCEVSVPEFIRRYV